MPAHTLAMAKTEPCPRCGTQKQTLCSKPNRLYLQGRPAEIESVEMIECGRCGRRTLTQRGHQTLEYFVRSQSSPGDTLH
jgi:transcription elongation factor Elf1